MKVTWSAQALERTQEIARHIASDDRGAAERWVDELFAAVQRLATFPESGRVVPELGARDTRELIFGAYRVFYRVSTAVEVLTVRHASQLIRLDELLDNLPTDYEPEEVDWGPPQGKEVW